MRRKWLMSRMLATLVILLVVIGLGLMADTACFLLRAPLCEQRSCRSSKTAKGGSRRVALNSMTGQAGQTSSWREGDVATSATEELIKKVYGSSVGGPLDGRAMQSIPRFTVCSGPESPSGCLTEEQFLTEFVEKRQPVLIRGLDQLADWPDSSFWNKEALIEGFGSSLELRVSLGTGFPLLAGGNDMQPVKTLKDIFEFYLQDPRLFVFDFDNDRTKRLSDKLRTPAWLQMRFAEADPVISLGGQSSGLPWHMHGETWFAPLIGRKRWFLYPPGHATDVVRGSPFHSTSGWVKNTLPNLAPAERPFTCLQEPGELLYLPASWAHATLNLDEVLGFGQQKQFDIAEGDYTVWAEALTSRQRDGIDPEMCSILGSWLSRKPDLLDPPMSDQIPDPLTLFRIAAGRDSLYIPAALAASRHLERSGLSGFEPLRAAAAALSREECNLLQAEGSDDVNLALVWLTLARLMKLDARTQEEHDMAELVASKILPLVREDSVGMEVLGVRVVET
eukprot:TRINITY_DN104703_c0_g1_i1.p1 TRINITY_DN104703_c0_g1~~TRINITY_DN104703_c0_g1_i1.p1  ORF type:complete len:507 (+),score=23.77 TRINITY_DN104703_c0_g1_i1:96-1616(+)